VRNFSSKSIVLFFSGEEKQKLNGEGRFKENEGTRREEKNQVIRRFSKSEPEREREREKQRR